MHNLVGFVLRYKVCFLRSVLLTGAFSGVTAARVESASIWFKAFIPSNLSIGITVPAGPHVGETMISGPIPFISDCFLTDNRSFSNDPNVSARLTTHIAIDFAETPTLVEASTVAGDTTELDCEDGDVEEEGVADTSRSTHIFQQGEDQQITITLDVMANNPLFTGSPDIDFDGIVKVDAINNQLSFSGTVEPFPAFEAYVQCDSGTPRPIFQRSPNPNADPFNLPLDSDEPVEVTVALCP